MLCNLGKKTVMAGFEGPTKKNELYFTSQSSRGSCASQYNSSNTNTVMQGKLVRGKVRDCRPGELAKCCRLLSKTSCKVQQLPFLFHRSSDFHLGSAHTWFRVFKKQQKFLRSLLFWLSVKSETRLSRGVCPITLSSRFGSIWYSVLRWTGSQRWFCSRTAEKKYRKYEIT